MKRKRREGGRSGPATVQVRPASNGEEEEKGKKKNRKRAATKVEQKRRRKGDPFFTSLSRECKKAQRSRMLETKRGGEKKKKIYRWGSKGKHETGFLVPWEKTEKASHIRGEKRKKGGGKLKNYS